MRLVKFRGKPIQMTLPSGEELLGDFVVGNLITHKDGVCRILVPIDGGFENYKVSPSTVSQFTSLYDVSGKEIYEGDILKWGKGRLYVVKFLDGMFYASVEECNDGILGGFPLHRLTEYEDVKCEIVGNIFDNPELLKGFVK